MPEQPRFVEEWLEALSETEQADPRLSYQYHLYSETSHLTHIMNPIYAY